MDAGRNRSRRRQRRLPPNDPVHRPGRPVPLILQSAAVSGTRSGSRNRQSFKALLDGGGVLDAGQAGVEAVLPQELLVGAALDDFAVAQHQELIGASDGAQAMGDDEAGAGGPKTLEGLLDEAFGGGVHAGGGLVEDKDGRVFQ